jgi:thiol-disulfide isomerase/thioredoxin
MSIKTWWAKPWAKNLVFFGILSLLYFTPIGEWISVEYTQHSLSGPGFIEVKEPSGSLYRYHIAMEDASGDTFALSSFEGKTVFLNLWASWCTPCLAEFEGLTSLHQQVPGLEMAVLNLESHEDFMRYMNRSSLDLPFYRLISPLPKELTAPALPCTYVIDAQGRVVYQYNGAALWDDPYAVSQLKNLIR